MLAVVIAVSGTASVYYARQERDETAIAAISASAVVAPSGDSKRFARLADPPRTVVTTSGGAVVATMTDGSRTVVLAGPARTFSEPKSTQATVTSTAWVRLAPQPWSAGAERAAWFGPWLAGVAGSTTPDVLAVALQDVGGALDSAGFVRMVYGDREGYPLQRKDTAGAGLPRSASAMSKLGPGTQIVADTQQRATDYSRLQPGDLLFFTLAPNLDPQVSHVGVYLGIDSDGHRRVLSIQKDADGSTFGGASYIDGNSKYSQGFRAAKRL